MSLLMDIQNAAVDPNTDVATLLRKCKVLSVRLGNDGFKQWVDNELNGYKEVSDLPEYRILRTQSYGDFSGSFGSGLRNAPIPPSCLPEKYRDGIRKSYLMQPISATCPLSKARGETTSEISGQQTLWLCMGTRYTKI